MAPNVANRLLLYYPKGKKAFTLSTLVSTFKTIFPNFRKGFFLFRQRRSRIWPKYFIFPVHLTSLMWLYNNDKKYQSGGNPIKEISSSLALNSLTMSNNQFSRSKLKYFLRSEIKSGFENLVK
jgi:hypothetical protein